MVMKKKKWQIKVTEIAVNSNRTIRIFTMTSLIMFDIKFIGFYMKNIFLKKFTPPLTVEIILGN